MPVVSLYNILIKDSANVFTGYSVRYRTEFVIVAKQKEHTINEC